MESVLSIFTNFTFSTTLFQKAALKDCLILLCISVEEQLFYRIAVNDILELQTALKKKKKKKKRTNKGL